MDEKMLVEAESHLSRVDSVLKNLIQSQELNTPAPSTDYFYALCRSIVGQQLSVKAAQTIFGRLEAKTKMSPQAVFDLTEVEARTLGLSKQKGSYIKDLSAHFIENPRVYEHLEQQSDEQVISELIAVRGIGVWTAQMFLIFTLGRPDVFAPDDLGLQRAITNLYGFEDTPSKSHLEELAAKWSPYRSVACLHLWHYLDNSPR